jgi:hypothetical protein
MVSTSSSELAFPPHEKYVISSANLTNQRDTAQIGSPNLTLSSTLFALPHLRNWIIVTRESGKKGTCWTDYTHQLSLCQ